MTKNKSNNNSKGNSFSIDKRQMYEKIMPSSLKKRLTNEDFFDQDIDDENFVNCSFDKKQVIEVDDDNCYKFNIMELLVVDKTKEALKKFKCCRCDRCINDIIAISLNNIKPCYVVCKSCEIEFFKDKIDPIPINVEIIKAILKVRDKPRH